VVSYREAASAGRALLMAGGAAEGGDLIGAYILRGPTRLDVNLQAVMDGKGKDVDLQARDILVVPTVSRETVHVAGAVLKPGPFYWYYADTVGGALDMAGGALPLADLAGAYVLRKGERLPVKLAAPAPAGPEGLGLRLEPNDVLIVPTRAGEMVWVAGAVQKPGSVPLQQAATGATAVAWAGGALPNAQLGGAYVLRSGQRIPLDLSAVGRNERDKDVTLVPEDVVIVPPVDLDPVYVVGSVKIPGAQPVTLASTAAKALMMAGGPVEDVSDLKAAYVLRGSESIPVDLDAVIRGGKTASDLVLKPHDTLFIPKRQDRFNVVGEVAKPGSYTLIQADTVLGAMSLAGPALLTADLGACTLLRRGQTIPVDLDAMLMDKNFGTNFPLEGGDVLIVPQQKARVFVFGAVARPGAYAFTKRDTYLDLIAKAGGVGPDARITRITIYRARTPEEILGTPKPSPQDKAALVRWKYSVWDLTKLDPKSPQAIPRDGDVVYVPGPRPQSFDIMQFLYNVVTLRLGHF
jgi:protein involved in polysaccharide export with SLBB domain